MSEPANPIERRLVLRLLRHWREICGDRDLPAANDVRGAAIADMWPYCFVVRVADETPAFTHFGDWHSDFYGEDMTGRPLDALSADTLAERATNYIDQVIARRVPIT